MSERVTMPALGESVTEGTVTQWLKSVGDRVEVDEPLLEVSTDKVDTEIPSPVAGTLQKILVDEDETADVGADLCIIGDGDADDAGGSDESASSDGSDAEAAKESDEATAETEQTVEETTSASPSSESDDPEGTAGSGSDSGSGDSGSGDGERVTMPALGESVTEGTITRWLKEEGDDVEVDEPLLEVSTDKVDTEIPSPVAGKLTKILVAEDETAEVGADLAIIGGSGGGSAAEDEPKKDEPKKEEPKKEEPKQEAPKKEEAAPKQEQAPTKDEAPKKEEVKAEQPKQDASSDDVEDASAYVTPLVRKLAADNGVDLSSLKGTGVGGRIRKQDVLDAAKAAAEPAEPEQQPAPAPDSSSAPSAPAAQAAPAPSGKGGGASAPVSPKRGTTEKMTRLRKIIAQRMVESLQVSAQLTAVVEVDMTRIAAVRAKNKESFAAREGAKLSFLPFIAVATVETLKAFPSINASVDGENIVYHDGEHLGIAVDTEKGLVVPVVKDAGDLNIAGIARKIADLAQRTRTNKIGPDELGGGTFTISNIGSNGSILDTPIINQPQVAILGTGAIVKRPVVVQDEYGNESIAIRSMMNLVLTYDHRIVDGADAGRFLSALKKRLEEGAFDV
ncbi:2-oxoglutarate dehydrogenase, E2 component, dihydrolipoamide succinyltransferase [Agilicoccus flavus]|uniref:2-oxoglutarate dehydrogenase, E2 component, dihydrolipoamide succinyltransferase n=1 Tax=Agilicoccus flavus TaxID=2775968 RepID=UPI001CF6DF02|nr:2-oxoglutarate dehydrogenase, E2 component, dihydrolipoamide succinyltransferase [Agilicoccus flavus]